MSKLNTELDFEIKRKAFHLCAVFFPLIYIFLTKLTMCVILSIITIIVLYLDTYRHENAKIKELLETFFGFLLRKKERTGALKQKSGASYMFLGLLLSGLLFSKGLAINSWLILIVSDSLAAIVGMKFGTKKIHNNKTIEGATAFFVSAVLVSVFSYFLAGHYTAFAVIIISCFAATCAEFFASDLKINDNFAIPIAYGLCTMLLNFIR